VLSVAGEFDIHSKFGWTKCECLYTVTNSTFNLNQTGK